MTGSTEITEENITKEIKNILDNDESNLYSLRDVRKKLAAIFGDDVHTLKSQIKVWIENYFTIEELNKSSYEPNNDTCTIIDQIHSEECEDGSNIESNNEDSNIDVSERLVGDVFWVQTRKQDPW